MAVREGLTSRIRPYTAADRQAVFRIAADTAFFGASVEAYLDDPRLFCEIFYRYYTDYESQNAWMAEVETEDGGWETAGFLMGCLDTRRQQRRWLTATLPSTLLRAFAGRYRLGRRTWRYLIRLAQASLRGEMPGCDLDLYPAHLHLNLAEAHRGLGLGRGLMGTYLERLRLLDIPGVHLHTTSLNVAACHLYESLGFELLGRRDTRLWRGYVDQPVENRCYGLRLR